MKKTLFPLTHMLKEARNGSKGRSLILEILLFIAVFLVTQGIAAIPVTVATMVAVFSSDAFRQIIEQAVSGSIISSEQYTELVADITENMPSWVTLVQLFATALCTVGVIFYCRRIEQRSLTSMGLHRRNLLREYGIGTVVGILLISLCLGVCLVTGSMTLAFGSFSPVMLVLFLVGFLIQGMSEEVICRGYMMVSVSRRNALWLAVMTNAVTFALLHLGNPGIGPLPLLNIALFGVLESVYVLKRGDLWGACAIHSLWNFFQGNVFGISVSGLNMGSSPLIATPTEGHQLINGGSFGLEGGLAVTLVIGIATLLMIFFLPVNREEVVSEE